MRTMKKILFPMAVLLITACNPKKETVLPDAGQADSAVVAEAAADTLPVDAVTSATAIANPASYNGTLVIPPHNFASVSVSMGGIVKSTSVLPGAYVKKGTVLAVLENPEFIDLQQTYLDSRAQLEYLETEYRRQQVLSNQEAASQKKFQQSKAEFQSMNSRVQASAAQLGLLGVKPESLVSSGIRPYLEVKAPISGYVSNVKINLGKHVAAGETLCDVIDKSHIMVKLIAYEKDLAGIKVGSPVQFRVNGMGKQTFHATLISVAQEVDGSNRSIELYANVLDGSTLFRPGMYVTARMAK